MNPAESSVSCATGITSPSVILPLCRPFGLDAGAVAPIALFFRVRVRFGYAIRSLATRSAEIAGVLIRRVFRSQKKNSQDIKANALSTPIVAKASIFAGKLYATAEYFVEAARESGITELCRILGHFKLSGVIWLYLMVPLNLTRPF